MQTKMSPTKRTLEETQDRFLFYSRSADQPAGRGRCGPYKERGDPRTYPVLESVPHWRRVLSNFWMHYQDPENKKSPPTKPLFTLYGKQWASVEHCFHAKKFRLAARICMLLGDEDAANKARHAALLERYHNLAWDGKWGRSSAAEARSRGGKGKTKGFALTSEELEAWDQMKCPTVLQDILTARFSQDVFSRRVLLGTKNAILDHIVTMRGKPTVVVPQYELMEVRAELASHVASFPPVSYKQ